jgi:uncharacterized protein (TIGR00661 family)
MNIVYGVSGEGLGHVFEAIQVGGRLLREGHNVKVLTYGDRACHSLRDFRPTRIEGINLYFNPEGLSLIDTTLKNLKCFPFYLRNWGRLKRELLEFRPDVFLTAYEPFTMVASHVLRKPLVSMDNQNELLHMKAPRGIDMFAFHLAKLATRVCTYGARVYIVKSFEKPHRGGPRVRFVSPVIQDEIRALLPTRGSHVLVYLTKENPELVGILKALGGTFIIYCNNRVDEDANLIYRAPGPNFLRDLSSCRAIIGTTGFSLIADAIFLKKPYFGVPLRKQFEQAHNAHFLRRSGIGEYSEAVTRPQVERFLADLPVYEERLAGFRFDPAEQEETLLDALRTIVRAPAVPLAAR